MDTMWKFLRNFKGYYSGEVETEEISSLAIKKYMHQLKLWIFPLKPSNVWQISLDLFLYICCFTQLLSGFPVDLYIPDLGKFLNITAGVELSCFRCIFINWNGKELTQLLITMNEKDLQLRESAKRDSHIKRLRDSYYVQEMVVFLGSSVFGIIFVFQMYITILFIEPLALVVPVRAPFSVDPPSAGFWFIYGVQIPMCIFVALLMLAADTMIGNIYNQMILHLDVLHYRMELLNQNDKIEPRELAKRFSDFAREFQYLRAVNLRCEELLRPFFINNIIATMIAVIFACVEIGIMVNVDPIQCFKPIMYFIFINTPFFYWCWLGNRINEKSTNLAVSAFMFKENTSTIHDMKTQILFMQMVQRPLTINAKPFFVLNFQLFVSVLKISYQFTAVFKSIYDR